LTGLTWSLISLLLSRFLFGAAEAGAYPGIARAFYAWLPVGERGLAQGINFSGSRLGAAFALPAIAWLITRFGWRTSFFILGGAGLLWASAWLIWFRNTPEEHSSVSAAERKIIMNGRASASNPPNKQGPRIRFADISRSPSVWIAMGQYFASNFTFFFCLTWLFPYLQRTYNLQAVQAGFMASAPLLAGAVGNWTGGWIVDTIYRAEKWRLSRQLPGILGFLLAASGLLASLRFHDPVLAVLCLSIAVFGADMTLPPSWAFCIDIGRGNAGAVSGTMNMAGNLGSFVTSLAFPYLLALTGSTAPFFIAGAFLNLIGAWLWSRADPAKAIVPH
jgi:ACS family glucarate transporter-like MFS transporter